MIPKCPTCGRKPSERAIHFEGRSHALLESCDDPIHDLADFGPAAVDLLREWDLPIVPIQQAGTGLWRAEWNDRRRGFLDDLAAADHSIPL